jgi:NitT/TauT family transport system ATP-binding protein
MSDRIVVFTPRPGQVMRVIDSPLGAERVDRDVRAHPEFARYRHEIRSLLRATQ